MTTFALTVIAIGMSVLLVLVTLVQMLYMDSVRVRPREVAFLELFRGQISERIGLRADDGILTFSLVKHTLLALLGAVVAFIAAASEKFGWTEFFEAAVISWLVMMIASYIVPQLLYRRTSGEWFLSLVPVVQGLAFGVRPLTGILAFLQSLAQLGEKETTQTEAATPQENIDALITAGAEEGILEEQDRKLIHSVVAFGDKTVRAVMTPRPSIVATSANASLEELRQLVIHEQYSRIPVYEDTIDNIIGFVHVRDMFELDPMARTNRKVREVMRPVRAVPESKRVNDLLREMQAEGTHLAIVVDEYGSTAGLVTMEDMVEEIVGEIRDEHEPADDVRPDRQGGYVVSGSYDLDHLPELFGFHPPEETESTTVGGLVTEWMGRVPKPGEVVERDGIRIEVVTSNELRVEQVRISRVETPANGSQSTTTGKE